MSQTADHRLDFRDLFAFKSALRYFEIMKKQVNGFDELQILLFIQVIEIRKTFFKRLKENGSSRFSKTLLYALRHKLVFQLRNNDVKPYINV